MYVYIIFIITCLFSGVLSAEYTVNVQKTRSEKFPVLLAVVDAELLPVARQIKKDCEFTGTIAMTIKECALPKTKKEVCVLFEQNYQLVVYLYETKNKLGVKWRLYKRVADDTAVALIKEQYHAKDGPEYLSLGHSIADALWPVLTGKPGFFSTKIAYCKAVPPIRKKGRQYKHIKHIYIVDFDGSNARLLVDTPTLNIAPRWHKSSTCPLLFYSECRASNMALMKVNLRGEKSVVSNEDGLNMLPSFSPDGTGVAYNISRDIYRQMLDPQTQKITKEKIISNKGNNVSPNLLDNGDIIYCSDEETKDPQIYYYHALTGKKERLTSEGYCTCPCYSSATKTIAYVRRVKGVAQLFVYNLDTKKHTQITFDQGHKEEPSFSPCGNYLVFSIEQGSKSRIAIMDLETKERRYITPEDVHATYPRWSPLFERPHTIIG